MSIRDVAKKADVSIATVSRYLNRPESVSLKKRTIIQNVIDELGYVPNALVQGVIKNEINVIGLIVPSVADSFFTYMAKTIENIAFEHGYSILLCNTDDELEKERRHLELLQSLRVSGIITIRPRHFELYDHLICPVVSFENRINPHILNIVSNDMQSGKKAFSHMYARGSRMFLMIRGPSYLTASYNRSLGFLKEAEKHHCPVEVSELPTDYNFNMGVQFLDDYLLRLPIDGIFAFSDMIAIMVITWLQEHGRHLPDSIRLVGFDDSNVSRLIKPRLTTFRQPVETICQALVQSLIDIIHGKRENGGEQIFETELLIRETT